MTTKPPETIGAAEANRMFSKLLQGVREGASYLITSHGRVVAKMTPVSPAEAMTDEERAQARQELFARLASQPAQNIGPWTRDELYDRKVLRED